MSAPDIRNVLPRPFLFQIWDKLKEKTDPFGDFPFAVALTEPTWIWTTIQIKSYRNWISFSCHTYLDFPFFPFFLPGPIFVLEGLRFRVSDLLCSYWTYPQNKKAKRKKRNFAMFPERGRLLSGQQSSTSSRLLYDGLPCFLGSARFVYAPTLNNWKTRFPCPFKTCGQKGNQSKKMEIVIQGLDGSLSLSLSTKIPIYMDRDLSMNRSLSG